MLKAAAMTHETEENLDPRIRRTRKMLQTALDKLLQKKEFEQISVQDIAEEAELNRATFYDHYGDKYSLLECMVGGRFMELLAERQVRFDHTCSAALRSMVLAVSDYLRQLQGTDRRPLEPHMELAIIAVVRRILLDGLKKHPPASEASSEMIAASVSWALYGAVKEWMQAPDRGKPEELADTVSILVTPMLRMIYDPEPRD
ncbi:TetR family transcriptional regulator [uncultured Paludibaculum sp.]|uniref:TetR/AcrR family transcriptional regulator n=1 Tax=uncultured Paludibaculum sp. TaxID=1765020 RepID=UPI002AAA9EBB|nr:TetR family transcriptional regulator [uncultured Paludibaculum sp.]